MSKYHAKRVSLDGHTFDSQAEARRYGELRLLEQAGHIRDLQVHPRYCLVRAEIMPDGETLRAIWYEADFQYRADGRAVVEDVKGVRTAVYRIKRGLFRRANPSIDFREVDA